MSDRGKISYASSYRNDMPHEIRRLVGLAVPMLLGQLSGALLGLTDSLMAAGLGVRDLAAISLGCALWIPLSLLCIGICLGLAPIVAHLSGENTEKEISSYVYNALFPALLVTAFAAAALLAAPGYLLRLSGIEPEVAAKTAAYLRYVALALPGMTLFHLLRNAAEGMMVALPAMVIGLAAVFLNVAFNFLFMYGRLGFPAMGAPGCGVATALIAWLSFFAMLVCFRRSRPLRRLGVLEKKEAFNPATAKYIFKTGFPISVAVVIENMIYYLFAFAAGFMGSTTVAAHQIAVIVSVMTFMLPLSMSSAAAVRVSKNLAIGSKSLALLTVRATAVMAHSVIIPVGIAVFLFRREIVAGFNPDPELARIAEPLFLAILALLLQDSVFGTALGVVRGFKDNRTMMISNFAVFCCLCAPLGYLAACTDVFGKNYGLYGLWTVIVAGYCSITLIYVARGILLFRRFGAYIYER